jgi:hypothetical protein
MNRRARRLCTFAAMAAILAAGDAIAEDVRTAPFPGVQHLHRRTASQNIHVLQVDLCAPGVSVRTTAVGERGRTVPSFGSLTGVEAAVNGDFFGSDFVTDGLAAHAGQRWGGSDHTYVGPLAFGSHRVELRPHQDQTGFEPWMREVVSGHPTILFDGQRRNNNGDPLCSNRNPRTAVGLSADRRTLIVAVVDGRASSRIGMTCDELSALMVEMGADDAMNLDGGGSSTFWLRGPGTLNVPSDGSPRTVGNHLGIAATGTGDAPFCPNRPPRGYLDGATCDAVSGWAQDEDHPDAAIDVRVYFDGGPGEAGAVAVASPAALTRADLCDAIGSCDHGYAVPVPGALRDGMPHPVTVYGVDADGIEDRALVGGPKTVTCDTPQPPIPADRGSRRHIVSADVLSAWGLHFYDVVALTESQIAPYPDGVALSGPPDLVRAAGEPAVYVLDNGIRRHVTSPAVMAAWRFSFGAVREAPAAELAPFAIGATWPETPFVFRGGTAAVYLLDVADPSDPDAGNPDPGDGDGGGGGDSDGDSGGEPGSSDSGGGCAAAPVAGGYPALPLLALAAIARRRRPRARSPRPRPAAASPTPPSS